MAHKPAVSGSPGGVVAVRAAACRLEAKQTAGYYGLTVRSAR